MNPWDPYDIPKEKIPDGVRYQWVAKYTEEGDRSLSYQYLQMCGAGWCPVPWERHQTDFISVDGGKTIEIGGQVLMEKADGP